MAPNNCPSIFPFLIDLNEDHPQQLFTYNHHHGTPEAASSLSSHSYHNFIDTTLEGGLHYQGESFPSQHEKADMSNSPGGSCDLASATPKNENCNVLRLSASKKEGNNEQENKSENISVKWMSSKMRLMRKMIMSSDQVAADIPEGSMQEFEDHKERSSLLQIVNSSLQDCPKSSSNTIRVCADCNTTKTPLWRSGPRGPKSLCNACGIRQRKARRAAMAAAAGGANDTLFVANTTTMKNKAQHKERKIGNKHLPFKKRCKFTARSGGAKKLCFEDLTINLNNNHSAFQRVFPQEDKEAAILLMAISQGLVHG